MIQYFAKCRPASESMSGLLAFAELLLDRNQLQGNKETQIRNISRPQWKRLKPVDVLRPQHAGSRVVEAKDDVDEVLIGSSRTVNLRRGSIEYSNLAGVKRGGGIN
jgi:hypothetical protein